VEELRRDQADRTPVEPHSVYVKSILRPDGTTLLSNGSAIHTATARYLYRWDTTGLPSGAYLVNWAIVENAEGLESLYPVLVILQAQGAPTP
jgi:hypothetical protein